MKYVVGMQKKFPNPETGVMELYQVVAIDYDEFGGMSVTWEKVAP